MNQEIHLNTEKMQVENRKAKQTCIYRSNRRRDCVPQQSRRAILRDHGRRAILRDHGDEEDKEKKLPRRNDFAEVEERGLGILVEDFSLGYL